MTQEKLFVLSEQTRNRCQVIKLNPKTSARFLPLSLEHFHYLYQIEKIDFNLYFRFQDTMVEFIKPEEFSKELLDHLWGAMQKNAPDIEVCVLRADRQKFEFAMNRIRDQKLKKLRNQISSLDEKTLDVYSHMSAASQMIVKGGIDATVVERVAQSAKYFVANSIDNEKMIATLSKMINCDPTLYDHSATVAMLAAVIATKNTTQSLSVKEVELIAQGGLYHDVGKTCVPSAILNKPGKFTPAEFEVMKTHTTEGLKVLQDCIENGAPIDELVARVAYEHHEKFCGGGYPCNHRGRWEEDPINGIHLFTRIVTIADVYSALLMKRVYKEAMSPEEALGIMMNSRNDYDPIIFDSFYESVTASQKEKSEPDGELKGRIFLIGEDGKIRKKA